MDLELETILLANLLKRALGVTSVTIGLNDGLGPDFLLLGESTHRKKCNADTERLHLNIILFIIDNESVLMAIYLIANYISTAIYSIRLELLIGSLCI